MPHKKVKWHKVAGSINSIEWQTNHMAVAKVAGKTITLARVNNQVFACAHNCPHASGILANGFIDATSNIVCPLHRYKFKLTNGRNVTGEGYVLKVYAVEEREDGVFVGFEESNSGLW